MNLLSSILSLNQQHDFIDYALREADLALNNNHINQMLIDKCHRCGTTSKPKGKNGWIIPKYDSSRDFITILFGNYEISNETFKHNVNLNANNQQNKLTVKQKFELKLKAEKNLLKFNQERISKANYYSKLYKKYGSCINHTYLSNKGIQSPHHYNLKSYAENDIELLCIGFYDSNVMQYGYQIINPESSKEFRGSISGCFWQYPHINPSTDIFNALNSFYIIGEGFATVISAYEAINSYFDSQIFIPYAIVAFNCGNLDKVIKATKLNNFPYILLVDNDAFKQRNAGIETALNVIKGNSDCRIYPLLFPNGDDANNYIQSNGDEAFVKLLCKYTPIKQFIGEMI